MLTVCRCWEGEEEGAAFSRFAFDPDLATVRFDYQLAECQTKAGRHGAACGARLNLPELVEDPSKSLFGNSFPGVADTDDDRVPVGVNAA